MSVEESPPAPSASLVAVYRHLIAMKRKLDEKQRLRLAQADAAPERASDSEGGEDVAG